MDHNENIRVAACIIVYNPDIERLADNINSVIYQVDKLLLVFNSKIDESITRLDSYDKLVLLGNETNIGIAAAINIAIEYCNTINYKWLLTLDQDSVCPQNLIKTYFEYINQNNYEQIGIVTCGVLYNEQLAKNNTEACEINECIQSGALLNVLAANEIGCMDAKMFIDQVDFEYCYRLRKNGYRIIQISGIYLNHKLGDLEIKRIGPIKFYVGNHGPIRKYYMVRNSLYCHYKYPKWRTMHYCLKKICGLTIKTILFEDDKMNKIRYIIKGIKDSKNCL